MIEEITPTIATAWNLRYLENQDLLTQESFETAAGYIAASKLVETFPNPQQKTAFFIGNSFTGNLLFNLIIRELLSANRISKKALRINALGDIQEIPRYCDIVLIDNLEFPLLQNYQTVSLINLIESLYIETKLTILNIPSIITLNSLPPTILNLMRESINIKLKGTN